MTSVGSSVSVREHDATGKPAAAASDPAVRMMQIEKSFPGVQALKGVDLDLHGGRVRGLVGENGAGKSTLMKILAGAYTPDAGTVTVLGQRLLEGSPAAARKAGVAAVYQEPQIVPRLTPVANVFLGQTIARYGMRSERRMRARFHEWCERLGMDVPDDGPAGALSIGGQQAVEIMRALENDARILILDEPTAALAPAEREALFRTIELLKAQGTGLVFISHNLDDVIEVCDDVTVLRDGRQVLEAACDHTSAETLVTAMLGGALKRTLDRSRRRRHEASAADEAIRVESLRVPQRLEHLSLDVRRGEILGIAGLVGAGRTTLLRALAGAEPSARGRLVVGGREVIWPTTPRAALRLGIALAPEDRRAQGLVMSLGACENVALPSLAEIATAGLVFPRRVRSEAAAVTSQLRFASSRLRARAGTLSGGNQQKLVLAKWLRTVPKVLLVDEPVRGIDVGAKAEIFELLEHLAGQGMAVVMASEETEELVALADRVVVLCRGRVTAELSDEDLQLERVLTAMFPAGER